MLVVFDFSGIVYVILNVTLQSFAGVPRKLLLLSPDLNEESVIRQHLADAEDEPYELRRINKPEDLSYIDFEHSCDAILLDMRIETRQVLDAIHLIGGINGAVALICLCLDHAQLLAHKDIIHMVDDYIVVESLVKGELPTRISHAIRRRYKEDQLLIEQTLLRQLLQNIPDAIYFKDLQSRFIKVSQEMNQIHGFEDPDALIGKTDFDLFSEAHAQATYDDEQAIIRTGAPLIGKLEKEILPDGTVRWLSTTKIPLRDRRNQIIGTMGMSRFITELKEAQEQLARESQLLNTVIDHAHAGIFVKDTDGRYLIVNKNHVDCLGATSIDDVLGKTLYDFFDQTEADQTHQEDVNIMQTGKGIEYLIDQRIRAEGSDLWLLSSKVPFYNKDGVCMGLVGISQDISNQKEVEFKLKAAIQTLKETQLQLIEAEKLYTVGRLAAGVAHEVKNPLSVITLGIDFLKQLLADSGDALDILNDMQAATDKANDVIFELLDYSSPHEVNMQAGNINEIIQHVLTFLRHNIYDTHIELKVEFAAELPSVLMDAPKMEQVLINLFLNAISVMPSGGELSVKTYTQKMQQTGANVSSKMTERFRIGDLLVVIEIKDTGSGLSDTDKEKVFDPFYSTKPTGNGTGLGLSVTQSIVDMHRGFITLDNRKNSPGACARIILPAT